MANVTPTLEELLLLEDNIDMNGHELGDNDVIIRTGNFKLLFKQVASGRLADWNNLTGLAPIEHLRSLYHKLVLPLPEEQLHYLTAVLVHCACDEQGSLQLLYQPQLMILDGPLEQSEPASATYGNYRLQSPPDNGRHYRITDTGLEEAPDAIILIRNYQTYMRSQKQEAFPQGNFDYDQFIHAMGANGDTLAAIFPFQEILTAYEHFGSTTNPKVEFLHATSSYTSPSYKGIRWKHHFILKVTPQGDKQEGSKYIDPTLKAKSLEAMNIVAPKNADVVSLIPPALRYSTYIIRNN